MSEMIERVAKAIELRDTTDSLAMARAAIAAMREPTDKMMIAAETVEPQLECFLAKEQSPSYIVWQAMIDEALK